MQLQDSDFVKSFYSFLLTDSTYIKSFVESSGLLSLGQYGHLNLDPLLNLANDSCATTCPQGIIIGGFSSVVCSFETGQTKIE